MTQRTKTIGAGALCLGLLALLIMSVTLLNSPRATSKTITANPAPAEESSAAILARYYPATPDSLLKIERRGDGFAPVFPEKKVDPKNRWSNPAKPVHVTFPRR